MNKIAKRDLMFSLITSFILLLSLCVMGAGDAADVPTITLDSPAALSTVDSRDGIVKINYSTLIPSGDIDVELRNISLYSNWTTDINYTWFVDHTTRSYGVNGTHLDKNWTYPLTGQSNVTEFGNSTDFFIIPHGYYLNFQAFVCTNVTGMAADQGNCTWSTNTSIVVDWYYDDTDPFVNIDWPENGSVVHNLSAMQINFTGTDDDYIQNFSLWWHYNTTAEGFNSTRCDYDLMQSAVLLNTGATTPFTTNTLNRTIIANFSGGNFTKVGDGFYTFMIQMYDFNTNDYNSTCIQFEIDNIVPRSMNFTNTTLDNTCDSKEFKLTMSEPSNISIYYGAGKNRSAWTQSVSVATFGNDSIKINLTTLLSNTVYYYNVTLCDESSNCNITAEGMNASAGYFKKEWSACDGWNAYGVLANMTNATSLNDIALNVSDSTIISWWNRTDQAWINYVVGVSTNRYKLLDRGDSIFTYTDNDSVVNQYSNFMHSVSTEYLNWTVNMSGSASGTDGNWTMVGLLQSWTMGNITANTDLRDNISVVSHYNNSADAYIDSIWGYSINNDTLLGEGDTLWFLSPHATDIIWYRNATVDAL